MDTPIPDSDSPQTSGGRAKIATRVLELLLAIACLGIAGSCFWMTYLALHDRTTPENPWTSKLALAYIIGFLGAVFALFAARLIVPRLRPGEGRLLGSQGTLAFGLIYFLLLGAGVVTGNTFARIIALALVLYFVLMVAIRRTFLR